MLLLKEDIIVFAMKTEHDCQRFLKFLFERGWTWQCCSSDYHRTNFHQYREKTVYYLNSKRNTITYGDAETFSRCYVDLKLMRFDKMMTPLFIEIEE